MKQSGLVLVLATILGLFAAPAYAVCGRSCICGSWNNYCQGGGSGGGGGGGGSIDIAPTPIDHARATYNDGNRLLDAGDNAGAEAAYRRALAANPNHGNALNNLGIAVDRQGRTREALDYYARAAALGVPEAASNHQKTRSWLEAEAARQARENEERTGTARNQVAEGARLLREGQYEAARQWFAAALKWDPNNPDARLAESYIQALEARDRQAAGARAQREADQADAKRAQQGSPKWVSETLGGVHQRLERRLETGQSTAWAQAQNALRQNGRGAALDLAGHFTDFGNRDGMAADLAGDFFDKGVNGKSPFVVGDRTPIAGVEVQAPKPPPKHEAIPDPKASKPLEKPVVDKAGAGRSTDADTYRKLEDDNARLDEARRAAQAKPARERDPAKRETAQREAEKAEKDLGEKRVEMVSYPLRRSRFVEPPPPTLVR